MRKILLLLFFWSSFLGMSQQHVPVDSLYKPDPYYLEDQFYFGISYIVLQNLPEGLEQNGFSNSVKLGFIRDIPINERRNVGFGVGLGLGWDSYYQNLRISIDETTGAVHYHILTNENYRSNSFSLNKIEMPIEFRWRGSTPEKYKFWRLYTGVVVSYVYSTAATYVTDQVNVTFKNIQIIQPWQYGLSLSVGYGTWNFNYYYGLSGILKKEVIIDGNHFDMKEMRFGVIYYFL